MLQARNLHSGYGQIPILGGVDLTVGEGEFVGVWGHNGMGKTTLLKTLMGYLPSTQGTIAMRGTDLTRRPVHWRARHGIGYVPQGRDIFPALTVADNLRIGCKRGGSRGDAIVADTLRLFPRLQPLLERPGGLLSGGEQQLLALARCLCGEPRLLLLDEPTEGIQPSIIDEIIATLLALRRSHEVAILIVEQNRECVAQLSDRVLLMQKGAITGEIGPNELTDEMALA